MVAVSISGCSTRYAVVSINSVSATDNISIPLTRVYTGADGLFIGNTPSLNYLMSNKNRKKINMCIITEAECYQTKWQMIEITHWAKTPLEAYSAANVNRILFVLTPINCQ